MARRRRRIAPEVYQEIHRMVREGVYTSAARVHRALEERFGAETPSVRTVQEIVRELDPPDPSGPWLPGPDNDPEDDARVLDTLAAFASRASERRKPIRSRPSQDLARWIAWVRAGWPDLDPPAAFAIAADFRARRNSDGDTRDLEWFLAFAPWRSDEAHQRYTAAVERGWAPELPGWYHSFLIVATTRRWLELGKEMREHGEG